MRVTSVTAWFLQIFGVQEDDFAIAPVILKGLLIDIEDHQQIAETKGAAEHANQRLIEALGLDSDRGVLRLSFTHYTSPAEVDSLIKALDASL